jgi:aspartyl aminopeptidase
VREDGQLAEKLVCVDRDLLMIPNLAIHMNREVNEGYKYNVQNDLLPLCGSEDAKGTFMAMLAAEAGVQEEEILGHDLFLYNRQKGTVWGNHNEFVSAPRLDDLQCAFASMEGLLQAKHTESIAVCCVLDNEEVGSSTKQGAASTFLRDTLLRINTGLGRTYEEYLMTLAGSFMISADNAHALHPNYTGKADPVNKPIMNKGIVIKYNANQKYCTDGLSGAVFKELCREAEVPYQTFVNRSDIAGGSTLGNISNTQVALNTVDIGLPQLAMHSCYETAGGKDTADLVKVAEVFYK